MEELKRFEKLDGYEVGSTDINEVSQTDKNLALSILKDEFQNLL